MTSVEGRALELLGSGVQAEAVAAALGVTPSYISQLLATPEFSEQVTAKRFESLQKHNSRDAAYDAIEDTLLGKLERAIPLMYKPADVLNAIKTINGAKRRGQDGPQQLTSQQNIVQLLLPKVIHQQFTTNIVNQVVKAGEQELHTLPAAQLLSQTESENDRLSIAPSEAAQEA